VRLTHSTGNVFADIGLPDADEQLVKADLAISIMREIRERGWTQSEAAKRLGLHQPDVSNTTRGNLEDFDQNRLQNILRRLGVEVQMFT